MNDLDRNDWFSAYSITARFDPHTNYFAPEEKNVLMLVLVELEGIGARLQKENDHRDFRVDFRRPCLRGKDLEAEI
jgi:carboxyl-terminal processing protease